MLRQPLGLPGAKQDYAYEYVLLQGPLHNLGLVYIS